MATSPPPKKSNTAPKLPESVLTAAQTAAMNAAVPKLRIGSAPLNDNMLGYVMPDVPNMMVLNERLPELAQRYGIKHTVPHEFEHVLQGRAAKRYDASWDSAVLAEYAKFGGTAGSLMNRLKDSAASLPLRERLQTIAGSTPAAYLGGMGGGQYSLAEQFAELSSLEAYSGKDLTKDPVVRKEFFGNDEALIATYKATTGYRQERTDARDLPPMTAQAPVKEAAAPSVLDQIMEAAKRIMK